MVRIVNHTGHNLGLWLSGRRHPIANREATQVVRTFKSCQIRTWRVVPTTMSSTQVKQFTSSRS